MDTLKSASFGQLFCVTFIVAATFQVALTLIGLPFALLAPSGFNLNGRPATGPGEALTVILLMLIAGSLMNAAISAGGAGVWLVVRKLLFKPAPPASAP